MAADKINHRKERDADKIRIDTLRKFELNRLKAMYQSTRNIQNQRAWLESSNEKNSSTAHIQKTICGNITEALNLINSHKHWLTETMQAGSELSQLNKDDTVEQMANEKDMTRQISNLLEIKSAQSSNDVKVEIDKLKAITALKMEILDVVKRENIDAKHLLQDLHMLQEQQTMAHTNETSKKVAQEITPTNLDMVGDFFSEFFC